MIAILEDIKAIYRNDPAARNIEFLFYAGFWAISLHRLTHLIWNLKIPLVPRIISQFTRFFTGVEIHPGARIGKGFFIDHGMGVVVGETTEIGENCVLFHNVTLGGTGKHKKMPVRTFVGRLFAALKIGADPLFFHHLELEFAVIEKKRRHADVTDLQLSHIIL